MSIVIKEIIISDNLEKFMEKVNFNFDQLLLAGGGPQGPIGPQGAIGPVGPKGDPGNKWYVGCTGTSAAIGVTLFQGDLFLQNECGASGASYGDVYEFNSLTEVFDNTGLNLIGPQGIQGPNGDNLSAAVRQGFYPAGPPNWKAGSTIGVGQTHNFHLLKGDSTEQIGASGGWPAGLTVGQLLEGIPIGRSRDTLWLGGLISAQSGSALFDLDKQPKLYIESRNYTPAGNTAYDPANLGRVWGGIVLGNPGNVVLQGLNAGNPFSFGNLLLDEAMNIRLTNFTDFSQTTGILGVQDNKISIESRSSIQLLGNGHGPEVRAGDIAHSLQIGSQLYYDMIGGTNPNYNPSGGVLIAGGTGPSFPGNRINHFDVQLDGFTKITGGGNATLTDAGFGLGSIDAPHLYLTTESTGTVLNDRYDIVINHNSLPNDNTAFALGATVHTSYISTGMLDATNGYISLGTRINANNQISPAMFIHGTDVTLGNQAQAAAAWANGGFGLNAGAIRLRATLTGVQDGDHMIVNDGQDGTMRWAETNTIINQEFANDNGNLGFMTYWDTDSLINACDNGSLSNGQTLQWLATGWRFTDGNQGLTRVLVDSTGNGDIAWGDASGTNIYYFTTTGSTSFTPDPNAKSWDIIAIAGGGGGGGGAYLNDPNDLPTNIVTGGAGGGGGAAVQKTIIASTQNTTNIPWTVYVGNGGNGGAGVVADNASIPPNGGTAGSNGEPSYVTCPLTLDGAPSYLIQANGGEGGAGGAYATNIGTGAANGAAQDMQGYNSAGYSPGGRPGGVQNTPKYIEATNSVGGFVPAIRPIGATSMDPVVMINEEIWSSSYINYSNANAMWNGNPIDSFYAGQGGGVKMFWPFTASGANPFTSLDNYVNANAPATIDQPGGGGCGGYQLNGFIGLPSLVVVPGGMGGAVLSSGLNGGDGSISASPSTGQNGGDGRSHTLSPGASSIGSLVGSGGGGGQCAVNDLFSQGLMGIAGGRGGDGGLYGAGGGGGGAKKAFSVNDNGTMFMPVAGSGSGGNGANGIVVIIEHT